MKATLVEKKSLTSDITSFMFIPETPFTYIPGQYMDFTLTELHYPDERGPNRHFSLSSSPTEKYICLTTRIRQESGYKKTLNELPLNAQIEIRGPHGVFCIDQNTTVTQILITGGIGVTPFRSFIKFATDKKLTVPVTLLYSASTPEELLFREELENLAKENSCLKLAFTVTKPELANNWQGETGRINENFIQKYVSDIKSGIFWICGPVEMVTSIEDIVSNLGVIDENIKSEKFTGY